ncbi:MAG: hypothetical protein LBV67_02885, partial [Streptococcaceae bacterium]|nr:hypothetical protein [Streptococcaceae bacterium]
MKKRQFLSYVCFRLFLYVLVLQSVCACSSLLSKEKYNWSLGNTTLVRFAILSDMHLKDSGIQEEYRLTRAFKIFKEIDPNMHLVGII